MKRLFGSLAAGAACAWLVAQPAACTYEVPALVSGAAGAGGAVPSSTAASTSGSSSVSTGSVTTCDLDGPPCTECSPSQACHPVYGCTQCAVDADCDDPQRPYCVEGRCRTCGDPTHCDPGEICQHRIGDEMECAFLCVDDGDCDDNDDICDSGKCVECVQGSCTEDRVCDPVTGTCEDCVVDADCLLDPDNRDTHCGADRRCHECVIDAHCGDNGVCINQRCEIACCDDTDCADDPTFPACDTTTARCVRCNTDLHCTAPSPYCQTASHQCVECLDASHCSPSEPYCDGSSCVACTPATEATDCDAPTPRCYGGACAECSPATQASDCDLPTPVCRGGTCVECLFDSDCMSPLEPHCSPLGTCVQCTSVLDCLQGLSCVNYECQ